MLTHALNVHLADIRLPWLLSVNYAPRDSIRCSTVVIARLAPVGSILALLESAARNAPAAECRQLVLSFAKIVPSLLIHPGTLRAVSSVRQEVFLNQARHRADSVQWVSDRSLNVQRVRSARRGGWQ